MSQAPQDNSDGEFEEVFAKSMPLKGGGHADILTPEMAKEAEVTQSEQSADDESANAEE